ncbi:MAG: hypothetical protein IK105_05715 [Thermoguttaceae bacterium]|nr:hypothetical protein [Thermoguttaceae bacterium]
MFTAEIISIGDELTGGALVDTNSAYLSRELAELGMPVLCHTTVGDDRVAMRRQFRTSLSRSDLVLITGGLGPTEDDLTRQAAAEAAGVDLVQDLSAMKRIRCLFEIRGRVMPASNEIQSYFPRGARVIDNPHGTAPGFELEVSRGVSVPGAGRAKALVFPGVPAELREMWEGSGRALSLDWQEQMTGKRSVTVARVLRTFGAGESDVESRLPHLIARGREPRVGITASQGVISLRITSQGEDAALCRRLVDETAGVIYEKLGDLVYGEGDDTLASVVSEKLAAAGKRLAVLEWGTRGYLAQQIPPAVFAGGLVDSGEGLIPKTLGLAADSPLEEVLRAWQKMTGAEAVAAVGPFPAGEEETLREKFPVPVAALLDGGYREASCPYGFHPAIVKPVFAARAFDLLRRLLF